MQTGESGGECSPINKQTKMQTRERGSGGWGLLTSFNLVRNLFKVSRVRVFKQLGKSLCILCIVCSPSYTNWIFEAGGIYLKVTKRNVYFWQSQKPS